MSDDDDCQIIEDNTNYKSITCERIPELFLDKLIAKKHFGKYGKISRFVLRPNRFSCAVDFENDDDAANALENGAVFNGQEFDIRYSQREVGHVQNTEEWVDPDVQAELDAMGNHARRMPMPVGKIQPAAPRVVKQKSQRVAPEPSVLPPQTAKVPTAVRAELEAILRKPGHTDEDKYRILDARDKLIRLTTVRTTDISKVVSIKGTCPDMCPEKERYMREYQHQVSNFEMEEGARRNEMDHTIAIKEYSRSSADQEVPLTHELRPESVLKMTMLYLMHRIMGLCDNEEVNTGDWFHFVWDRTRSVRKDITQQELCSPGGVQLVEQCARFHIHCAARLVAEDPSVFDQKINTENLTKCLQTLKYMYNDLRIKGVGCEHEAEFRGYIVLLNLNDGNFLWELQELPEEIQNSKEIRSAIAFYKCMESNNYVRFFNLVRETTYMNACILLRYFTQVRLKALRMIIKAYNWPRHLVSLPLSYLAKILGFESDDEAMDFFSYYGLECDQDRVPLDRNAFEEPDVPVLMERAFEIVESKRQVGVGESVCGQPLDCASIFEDHKPHNSFDANGYLRYESFNADDQLKNDAARKTPPRTINDNVFKVPAASPPLTPKQQLKSIFASTSSKPEREITPPSANIFVHKPTTPASSPSPGSSIFKIPLSASPSSATTSLFGSTVFQTKPESSGNIFGGIPKDTGQPAKATNNIFGSTAQSFANDNIFQHFNAKPLDFEPIQPVADDVKLKLLQEREKQQRKLEEDRQRKIENEKEETKRKEREEQHRLQRIAEQRQLDEKRRTAAIARLVKNSDGILFDLLDEVEENLIRKIATTELQNHMRVEKLAQNLLSEYILEYIKQIHSEELKTMRHDQSLLHTYFHSWRELTLKKKTQRNLIATIPVWMTTDTLEAQAEKIAHPRQAENLQMMKRYRLGYPCDFKALLDEEQHHRPIDIFAQLHRHFSGRNNQLPTGFLKRRKYYKLVISLPAERDELPGFNSYANNWLEKNVARKSVDSTFMCHCEGDLALCVRKVSCIVPKNEENERVRKECDHADALVFFTSPGNVTNSRKRLHHLLKLSTIYRAIPVAILVYNPEADSSIEGVLDMESLVNDGKVSHFNVFNSSDYTMKSDIQKALRFVAKNDNYLCPLEAQSVVGFLNTCLGDELWQRLHKSWSINPSFRKICSIPRYLITIYNDAIDRLIEVIDEDFQDYPELSDELRPFVPPTKFDIPVELEQFPNDWKNVNRTKKLINFLKKLKLAPANEIVPHEIDDLELWILNYTSACIPNDDEFSMKAGYHAIKRLINELNQNDLQDLPLHQSLNFISWLPIIREVSLAILNHQWSVENSRLPSEIIYNRKEFMEFQSKPWWLENESVKSVKMTSENEVTEEEEDEPGDDITAIIARAKKASSLADTKLKQLHHEANNTTTLDPELTKELDESLYKFEVDEKCRSFKGAAAAATLTMDDEDSLELPPLAKKFKPSPDKMNVNQIMERAFAILKKTECIMDRHRRPPMREIQSDVVDKI